MTKPFFLKRVAREILAFMIRMSGIRIFIREIYARNKISIIMYHDPDPEILESHIQYFVKQYEIITLENAVNTIRSKDWSNIPKKSLVITLDDGRRCNFKLYEIFNKYGIVPTIYISSQLVVNNLFVRAKAKGAEHLRKLLTCDEIASMKNYVDFQSHAQHHPMLPLCGDEECEKEIFESKREIEILTGKNCSNLSYPFGCYTDREFNLLKRAGYLSARTIDVGWNTKNTDLYKLKILGISDDASLNWAVAQMSGIILYARYFINGSLRGKFKQKRREI